MPARPMNLLEWIAARVEPLTLVTLNTFLLSQKIYVFSSDKNMLTRFARDSRLPLQQQHLQGKKG